MIATRTSLLLVLFTLASCSRPKSEPAEPAASSSSTHEDEPEHNALPRRVRLDPKVIADAKIVTAAASREKLAGALDLPGEIASDPDKTARIAAPIGGRIVSINFKEGQSVKRGDVLGTIRVPDLAKAKAALASTSARAMAARSNAARLQALAEKRLAASQEVLAAEAEADALDAEARAAQEELRALGTGGNVNTGLAIRAPIGGVIVSRQAVVGQPVAPEDTIGTIADLAELWFLGRVFERTLGRVHVGAAAEVELNAYPNDRFVGTVDYLGKQIDPAARTVVARIQISNRDDLLRLGLFGIAHVSTGELSDKPPTIVIPRDAVTEIGGKPVVFVRQPDEDFEVHDVVLGDAALGRVQVLNGLREGEQVVVQGVFTLKSALLKSTFGEEE